MEEARKPTGSPGNGVVIRRPSPVLLVPADNGLDRMPAVNSAARRTHCRRLGRDRRRWTGRAWREYKRFDQTWRRLHGSVETFTDLTPDAPPDYVLHEARLKDGRLLFLLQDPWKRTEPVWLSAPSRQAVLEALQTMQHAPRPPASILH